MRRGHQESETDEHYDVSSDQVQPITFIEVENNLVWRFPIHISQSSIGGKTKLSNACTLIALKIAELIHIHNIKMPLPINNEYASSRPPVRVTGGAEMTERTRPITVDTLTSTASKIDDCHQQLSSDGVLQLDPDLQKCPSNVISCLINGIVDGNEAYWKDAGNDSTRVYNLPDAIKACDLNFSEVDFKLSNGTVQNSLPRLLRLAVKCPIFRNERRLMFVMIGCIRTVLIVYDRDHDSLTLFDTHMHLWHDSERNQTLKHGALISTCSFSNVHKFASWVQHFVFPDMKGVTEEFEISLVQPSVRGAIIFQNECNTHQDFKKPIKIPVFRAQHSSENKENTNEHAYPVLREILSRPPLTELNFGMKRRLDFENGGGKSGTFGKRTKINM